MKYQEQYNELKELKAEIERIQKLLERSRERMQKDFESWLSVMIRQLGGQSSSQQMSASQHMSSSMGQTSAS